MGQHRIFWVAWLVSLQHSFCFVAPFQPRPFLAEFHAGSPPLSTCATSLYSQQENDNHHHDTTIISLAEEAFSVLAKRKRTWRRMRHLVDLALIAPTSMMDDDNPPAARTTVADIGTDHGILPIALASTGRFEKVMGVDISDNALSGAKGLHQEVQRHLEGVNPSDTTTSKPTMSPIDFRVGDGFAAIQEGEADVVCIAGMGANTMVNILTPSETDRVGCRVLLLQPTNPKPGNLVYLYDTLQSSGWRVMDERIDFMKSRWYLSVAFCKVATEKKCENPTTTEYYDLPGMRLLELGDDYLPMKETFNAYVKHHIAWLEKEEQLPSGLHEPEVRWLGFYREQSRQ